MIELSGSPTVNLITSTQTENAFENLLEIPKGRYISPEKKFIDKRK